jgi:hypothetical protein
VSLDSRQHVIREHGKANQRRDLVTVTAIPLADCDWFFCCARVVKVLELTETTGDGPTAPNGFWKTLRTNSGPCNVVLRPFRISSLKRHVQPATMIGFKQIEFFDHTGLR